MPVRRKLELVGWLVLENLGGAQKGLMSPDGDRDSTDRVCTDSQYLSILSILHVYS